METIKKMYEWLAALVMPLRKLPGSEDGKYVHTVIGVVTIVALAIQSLLSDAKDLNFIGMILLLAFAGVFTEILQRAFLGGKNTLKESFFDTLWVVVGGLPFALILTLSGFARWVH